MAGKGLFKMKRQMSNESDALSAAGSKQSAWSKLGMGLGGIAAMALTGGAATPLVAAMMAGGGTLAGGLLGRQGAKKGWFGTDKAKMKGGRFYRDEADKWKSDIGGKIWTGAAKAGLGAGMTALGSGLTFGKEGLKAAIPGKSVSVGAGGVKTAGEGFKMGDIVKRGTETATYSDSLMGKLGKAIDIKGSLAGKGVSKIGSMLESRELGRELQEMGEASLGGGPSIAEGTGSRSFQDSLAQGPPAPADLRSANPNIDQIGMPSRRHAQFAPGEMSTKIKSATEASKTEYLDSLLPNNNTYYKDETAIALENLRNEAGYNLDSEQGIMDAAMEGYNTPYGIEDLEGVGTGQGYDPGDQIFQQQNRGAFMDELALEKSLGYHDRSLGVTSPDLLGRKHRNTLDSLRWHNRLFGD